MNADMEKFVLATYNLRVACDAEPFDWASRCPRMRKLIEDDKIDIYGTQEGLKEQLDTLLAGTHFAYVGGGRDDFKDAGEHSCIVYNTDRFELLKGGTFGLSERPDVPGFRSWDTCCPRIATWCFMLDKRTGKRFCFYNTHLDHVSELARVEGIKMLVEHAKKNCTGVPMVLSGDFNAYPDSETYHIASELLKDSKLISKTPHRGPGQTFHNWGNVRKETNEPWLTQPIDYIFVSDGVQILSHWTDDAKPFGNYASDHYPLITEIIL